MADMLGEPWLQRIREFGHAAGFYVEKGKVQVSPFIMVTAESKVDNAIAAKKAGVNSYIVKRFSAQALKAKVEELFPA